MIDFPYTPITEETFERQGWLRFEDNEDDGDTFHYWILPLPKDNPDDKCPVLISSADDEYSDLGLEKGQYMVEIDGMLGLGMCRNEEEIELLYRALTRSELE
jgi:hypothetical protein